MSNHLFRVGDVIVKPEFGVLWVVHEKLSWGYTLMTVGPHIRDWTLTDVDRGGFEIAK